MNLPQIDFPSFPIDIDKVVITIPEEATVQIDWIDDDKTVAIPEWFWQDLLNYGIDVNTAEKKYCVLRKKYSLEVN